VRATTSSPLILPLDCFQTQLFQIRAGLRSSLDTEFSSPFNQIRLNAGLEFPQRLLNRVPVHVPHYRSYLISRLLPLPADPSTLRRLDCHAILLQAMIVPWPDFRFVAAPSFQASLILRLDFFPDSSPYSFPRLQFYVASGRSPERAAFLTKSPSASYEAKQR
jgi:hypothetical protein